jgi:hypothetical protein
MSDVLLKTFDEFYALLNAGWNCAEAYTPDYEAEHESVHVMMKRRLHGLLGGTKNGNFSFEAFGAFEDCWTVSRVVGAYLKTEAFLVPDFVRKLQQIVDDFPSDYLLHISAEDFDPDICDFELAITKSFTWALIYGDSSELSKIHENLRLDSARNEPEQERGWTTAGALYFLP